MDVCRFCFFKQKTAYEVRISDGSSDVCSSDLDDRHGGRDARAGGGDPRRAERLMAIRKGAVIGLGLIGSSIARAVVERLPEVTEIGRASCRDRVCQYV